MEQADRPIPLPDAYVATRAFWDGAREKQLLLQYCTDTGRFQHYPRPVDLTTGSRHLEWRPVSGNGEIYACTILRIPGPGLAGRLPLSIATIDLDEGVRIIANIVDCDPLDVKIGMRVELTWDYLAAGAPYPAFRPA